MLPFFHATTFTAPSACLMAPCLLYFTAPKAKDLRLLLNCVSLQRPRIVSLGHCTGYPSTTELLHPQ